ncbi:MAG: DNA-deoxyinosine glycosylase, partial [Eubacterium sp.]|nr:DNA-deoxyinosine glycosylase [Eubacterium sp.]
MEYQRIQHPIPPLYDRESRILILGSFPSVKSREAAFFYGHPQNRFWRLMAALFSEDFPETVEDRREFLHRNHVAVWDSIASCEIIGSSDSSIRNVQVNDLSVILDQAPIEKIYCNGAKSHEYYKKYIEPETGIRAVKLPSTSPANAAFGMDKLMEHWKQILIPLRIAPPGIGRTLLDWYDYNGRILPWRSDPSPYHVWISEIMLQQTRVEAVKAYYDRWMEELPDVEALAGVPDDRLMKLWEGLGYYNRARNLKEAAIKVMDEFGGQLPGDYEQLLSLKGIGEYTAGAIASIAFGLAKAAVDGNVLRVFSRILMEPGKISSATVKRDLTREVIRIMPKDRPGDYNQALMDLGAGICLPNGKPLCEKCPWESVCQAHTEGRESDFPVREEKKSRRVEDRAVFLIEWE